MSTEASQRLALHAGKTIGVLGGGQLGMMLAEAGRPHGLSFRFLDPSTKAPAQRAGEHVIGKADDMGDLQSFAVGLDACTFEFENVNADAVGWMSERMPACPNAGALRVSQDRLSEKTLFTEIGIPTPAFEAVESLDEVEAAADRLGLPLVLKTRRLGYDGKGQAVIRERSQIAAAHAELAGRELIAEAFVPFERELSVVAVRSRDGATAAFPLVENEHRGGILRRTTAPAMVDDATAREAHALVSKLLSELDYVGVVALELFVLKEGNATRLLANEMAPRVHNSGHWSIDGSPLSQFEAHLLALLGEPIEPTSLAASGHSVMINLIGDPPPADLFAGVRGAATHLYGKTGRPGRKVGHVTVTAESSEEATSAADQVESILTAWAAHSGATVGP